MPFKFGDLAYIATTGEKVIVLGTLSVGGKETVTVRRPVNTKECGLQHVENTFFEFELESFEQQLEREVREVEQIEMHRSKLNPRNAPTQSKVPFLN